MRNQEQIVVRAHLGLKQKVMIASNNLKAQDSIYSRWDYFNSANENKIQNGMQEGFPYPLSKEMYDVHYIRGEEKWNVKSTLDVVYEAVSRKFTSLVKKDFINQNFNIVIFDCSNLAFASVIVSSEADIDFVEDGKHERRSLQEMNFKALWQTSNFRRAR